MHSIIPLDPIVCAEVVASKWGHLTVPGPGDCIDWKNPDCGRAGWVTFAGGRARSYRVAWVALNGIDVPEGLMLDHFFCNRGLCVNGLHVRPASPRENTLRSSDTVGAINRAKEFCPAGHLLAEENLDLSQMRQRGVRSCRSCKLARQQEAWRTCRQAAALLGLTNREYRKSYGWSAVRARAQLNGEE